MADIDIIEGFAPPPAPFRSHSATIKKDVDFSNKRLRIDDNPWRGNIRIYFEQIQNTAERAEMIHEEKEKEEKIVKQQEQDLLDKLHQRDVVMEHLRATTVQELRVRNFKIVRLEHELSLMGSVLDGYKKNLKETQREFDEYKQKAQRKEKMEVEQEEEENLSRLHS